MHIYKRGWSSGETIAKKKMFKASAAAYSDCTNQRVVWNFNYTKIFCFIIDYMFYDKSCKRDHPIGEQSTSL